ncbi:DinB family protein [Tengunoibacter tsumagoiensis]|uniref:ClbS/DfsB family four-helix bundle protein n=1 Tax=Tengunoibacter tsumagoiensis TaxID=2014871 RepID=A0A402A488_9CHLR|nr:DinB family protein [Tengunoibacter tsumagoiensis]GCE13866.1 hypothetical protein KTT_37250 [Tengunoibacter tsumagoiensis]
MSTTIQKEQFLERIRTGYTTFQELLQPLTPEQLTTPNVNGQWSIKDNLAHLSAWQKLVLNKIEALRFGVDRLHPPSSKDEDAINEEIYQQNKDLSLAEVQADFQATSQQLLAATEQLSEEQLNSPYPWGGTYAVWENIAGNTYDHYQEHATIILSWLAQHS